MSTDNNSATLLSKQGDFIFPSKCLPLDAGASGRKGLKASCRTQDAVCPLIHSHWQVPISAPPSAETVPGPHDTSHDCQSLHLPYNRYPALSAAQDPPFKPRQGQSYTDSPWPDASLVEEFLLHGFLDRYPLILLTKDALPLATPSLAPGVDSPPLSDSPGATFIPERHTFSGSPTINSPVADTDRRRQSRKDRHHREAWMPAISQIGTNRYRDNAVEAVIPYDLQSSFQLSHRPRRKPRYQPVPEPYFGARPVPSLSPPSPVYASTNYSSSSPLQAAPHPGAANEEEQPEKKYWCSKPGCGRGFTLPQVLGRHVKDMHEAKESCSICLSQGSLFTFSRGRPYVYRKHLEKQHREIALPDVRQRGSGYANESLNLGSRQAQNPNYVPPLTRVVPLQDMSYYPWAN
ncbi:hypothetical protein V8E53_001479 [Lactarius tabidus]